MCPAISSRREAALRMAPSQGCPVPHFSQGNSRARDPGASPARALPEANFGHLTTLPHLWVISPIESLVCQAPHLSLPDRCARDHTEIPGNLAKKMRETAQPPGNSAHSCFLQGSSQGPERGVEANGPTDDPAEVYRLCGVAKPGAHLLSPVHMQR